MQAYIAECRAKEEKAAKEQALAKQKEALKAKVKKKSAPAVKKNLTLETDNLTAEKKESDDDFERDGDPITKDELEKESSNSVDNL